MKKIVLISIINLIGTGLLGQSIFQGNIINAESSAAIESVTVLNLRSNAHSHSDSQGRFNLSNTLPGDTISFHLLGYETKKIVASSESINVSLKEQTLQLDQIVITPSLTTLNTITAINTDLNPIQSSQDILQSVPGLFIAQHAGSGKAEQIFLRGFDIDHGTDIQITTDGMPVNMVSHAHGQGYSDLHFLIPETIKNIDFGKGPYYTSKGNFTTAGYVNFQTEEQLTESSIKMELGSFNTKRIVGLIDLISGSETTDAYLATSYQLSDGPFESPQNFDRLNVFGKYITQIKNNKLTLQASTFNSQWNASGQIPQRSVADGSISRFGAIDDTEGGSTSRSNFRLGLKSVLGESSFTQTNFYFIKYDFELFSNFTFFLNDPENGDQIRQKESRNIIGFNTAYTREWTLGENILSLESGVALRNDQVKGNELSHTLNRSTTLEAISLSDVNETNIALYADTKLERGAWLFNLGIRADQFQFEMVDHLAADKSSQAVSKSILSPSANVVYSPSASWQLYTKTGKGFHSNDTRVILDQTSRQILPSAYGYDLGGMVKPFKNLYINAAFWSLYLQQEFVYVGDEGIVEAGGKTLRQGIDLGVNYQINSWLFADVNTSMASPKLLGEPEYANHIPLAPTFTSVGGLSAKHPSGLSASLRYRYMADRPANEDNSITASGYFLTSAALRYDAKHWGLGLTADNLLNQKWNEAQFATTSQLAGESSAVEELHFTPGSPLFIRLSMQVNF